MAGFRISKEAQDLVIAYAKGTLDEHKRQTELRTKMEIIDKAYARYKETGIDEDTPCGDIFGTDAVTPPIVVSQVDSIVAYWADIFLSGFPLFPVVSSPEKRDQAEKLESLLDDHAMLGAYPRHLLLFLQDAAKYNIAGIECDWESISQYSVDMDFLAEGANKTKISTAQKAFTKLNYIDTYNLTWDSNVNPAEVQRDGDYAGHIKMLNRVKLKRLLNKFSLTDEHYNVRRAEESGESQAVSSYYINKPDISKYVTNRGVRDRIDWAAYAQGSVNYANRSPRAGKASNYEVYTLYARIIPSDFSIRAPSPNTPQIWKFVIVNSDILVHAKRIISAYDSLPILIGQPREDGFGTQTQAVAESSIDFQEAANTLYNIRFAAARRAVSDRALYDADMIRPSHINSKAAAPKIPVKIGGIQGKSLADAYHAIPFDMRGTETTLQDATLITEFGKELTGLNNARRGQFQKGNKSVQEWNDVMGAADNRLRLPALALEHQVFYPLKQILLLNIFQYGSDAIVVSQRSGQVLKVNLDELRKEVLAFRLADGYSPKAKLASVEMLQAGMQILMNSPLLQQAYGAMLPNIFAHMMQLGGVRGFDEYAPKQPQGQITVPQ